MVRGSAPNQGSRGPRRTFRRAHTRANESFKDCNCWTCGAKGHISTDCPDNQRRGVRRFEATPEIEEAVYYQDLIQVYQFEDVSSDDSIYEEEYLSEDESSTESESD